MFFLIWSNLIKGELVMLVGTWRMFDVLDMVGLGGLDVRSHVL